jgi:hypothetical protein
LSADPQPGAKFGGSYVVWNVVVAVVASTPVTPLCPVIRYTTADTTEADDSVSVTVDPSDPDASRHAAQARMPPLPSLSGVKRLFQPAGRDGVILAAILNTATSRSPAATLLGRLIDCDVFVLEMAVVAEPATWGNAMNVSLSCG